MANKLRLPCCCCCGCPLVGSTPFASTPGRRSSSATATACPAAAAVMADLGATVIKVEAVEGDSMRFALGPPRIPNPETPGRTFPAGEAFDAHFNFCNRGKKSICVALGEPGEHGSLLRPAPLIR